MNMTIVSAEYDPWGNITVVLEGQKPDTVITVPQDERNKDYQALQQWVGEGGEVKAYVPPPAADPEPTVAELATRVDAMTARIDEIIAILHSTKSKK